MTVGKPKKNNKDRAEYISALPHVKPAGAIA